jgi:hypothetical protein
VAVSLHDDTPMTSGNSYTTPVDATLDANYTQSQVIGVTVKVRRVPQEAAGSDCAAVLLYSGAVKRTVSAAATTRGVR